MTELLEKIANFKDRQKVILDLNADFKTKVDVLAADCESRMEAIKTEYEVKKAELGQDLEKAKESYKVDLKAEFGVTDGESANILDLVGLIHRVASK